MILDEDTASKLFCRTSDSCGQVYPLHLHGHDQDHGVRGLGSSLVALNQRVRGGARGRVS